MRERQKLEAINRMIKLKLHENVIKEFEIEDKLYKSEFHGILYWLNVEEEKIVRDWEQETGNLAYHIIHNNTEFGELLSIFYVSQYEEEWEMDMRDLSEGIAIVYVKNLDDDWCSEYGSIGFKRSIGGLVRTS